MHSDSAHTRVAFFVLLTAPVAWATVSLAQRQSPAEGPWSGQAQCVVVAKSADYQDEQTHTWKLTGAPPAPAPRGSAQVYYTWPATWTVQGGGRKTFPSRTPGATGPGEQTERWTIASEMNATLRITEIGGKPDRLRIGADGQRGAPLGSIRVTEVSGRTRDAAVQPWSFPAIEDEAASATISGTSARTFPEGFGVGPGLPPTAITTATCTWRFTRASADQSSRNTPGEVAPVTGGRGQGSLQTAVPGAAAATAAETNTATPRDTAQSRAARGPVIGAPAAAPATPSNAPANPPAAPATTAGSGAATTVPPVEKGEKIGNLPEGTGATLSTPTIACTLPLTVPPASVRVSPGSVAFAIEGIRIGCDISGGFGIPCHPLATHYEAHYVIRRNDRNDPVQDLRGKHTYTEIRTMMEYGRTYTFSVSGEAYHLRSGTTPVVDGCGQAQFSVTPPLPAVPVITSTNVTGNTVLIRWDLVSQAESGYLALGPGLPAQGTEVRHHPVNGWVTSVRTGPLSSGTHAWVITPFWETPDGRVIDVNRGARATATIP
jgi:hypothetical protein